jgi:RNA polymerase primary sigma factor
MRPIPKTRRDKGPNEDENWVHDAETCTQKNPEAKRSSREIEWKREAFDLSELAADDVVGLYLKETATVPMLSFEEEIRLAKAVHRGREAQRRLRNLQLDPGERKRLQRDIAEAEPAYEHLILANTRLVISVAKKYRGHGVPFIDLIQEGNLGLMKALEKYDHTRGYRFSTYATWWIRQHIVRAIACQGRTIRIPVHMHDRIRRMYKIARQLEQKHDRRPTPEEIANEIGLKPRKVRWMLKVSYYPLSLEQPVGEDEEAELGRFIADSDVPRPAESASQGLLRDQLERSLNTLTPREAHILRLRFGLKDGWNYTLEEVGTKYGLTRERIRQIEHKALRRLRHPRRSRRLRGYLA